MMGMIVLPSPTSASSSSYRLNIISGQGSCEKVEDRSVTYLGAPPPFSSVHIMVNADCLLLVRKLFLWGMLEMW